MAELAGIRGWRETDIELANAKAFELLEIAHARIGELANLADDDDRVVMLGRWARGLFEGYPWDLAQDIEAGRYLATWVIEVLAEETADARRQHMIEHVSEGW